MSRREILTTRYGEMLDMLSCLAIYHGQAEPASRHVRTGFDATLEVM